MDVTQPTGSYWLVAIGGKERRVRLSAAGPLLVGRGAHNHLVLNDSRISRQHSRVAPERDGFVVYDLNSVNGTFVNGVSVKRQALKPNDEVRFGPFAFHLDFQTDLTAIPGPPRPARMRPTESVTIMKKAEPTTRDLGYGMRTSMETIPDDGGQLLPGPTEDFAPTRESSAFPNDAAPVDLNLLESAYEKLNTLYAFMQAISKTIDKRELLDFMAGKILEIFPAARSVGIYMRGARDRGDGQNPFQLIHFAGEEDSRGPQIMPDEVSHAVLGARRAIFDPEGSTLAMDGLTMYAPMIDREDALGVICVAGDSRWGGFTVADLDLLNGMASPAAIMLQNTKMHEETLQHERLRRDLELAAQIQKSFLPQEMISVPGVEFLATYKAAYTVGGDFYDVFWVGPDHLAVFIGDISGKGVAAALLMARISGEVRVAALAHVDPVAVLSIMNKAVIGRGQPELFFTAIYFTLDVRTGEVWLATAGHPSPYLCHANGIAEAITEGAAGAVGMLDDPQFSATQLFLADGDSLVLYTDGVVEASDAQGRLYGEERLEECLSHAGSRPKDISEHILRSVAQHTLTAKANDDLTILICHRRVGSSMEVNNPPRSVTARR